MEDWQRDVLLSPNIACWGEKPMKIARAMPDTAMTTEEIMRMIRSYKNKIVIMNPEDPFRGKYAEKKAVLAVLSQRDGPPASEPERPKRQPRQQSILSYDRKKRFVPFLKRKWRA